MSGLIRNDQVEVYHLLRPSVRAGGCIVSANQLDCTMEVVAEKKLADSLNAIYQICKCLAMSVLNVHNIIAPYFCTCIKRMKSFVQKMGQLSVFVW